MVLCVFSHPIFGVGVWLVFWFRRFFGFCWDGNSRFFVVKLCWMGWDRMGDTLGVKNKLLDIAYMFVF